MINPQEIGRRIRVLRRQKKLSQEQMALDLGLHQADISNIERATGNGGINDITRLDMIAEYLGVSLVSLLTEAPQPAAEPAAPVNVKLKAYEPDQYRVLDVSYLNQRFSRNIAELQLEAPSGKTQYVSFLNNEDTLCFFQTRESLFADLQENAENPLFLERHVRHCFLSGSNYAEIFGKADPRWVDICRCLIYVATEKEESAAELTQRIRGKRFCEVKIPKPEAEPSEMVDIDWTDLSAVYRYRLWVEIDLKNPSPFTDMDDNIKTHERNTLKKLKAACQPEEAYQVWKKDLIEAKLATLLGTEKFITCIYIFAGIGQYQATMPESELEGFECWINANGSAFFGGVRPATKPEIRDFAARCITEDLWV